MLHEFIALHRDAIIARTRQRVGGRAVPHVPATTDGAHGVGLFLTQLAETLRLESTPAPFSSGAIGAAATRHGAELRAAGLDVSQVVHDYGDICQAVTETALERGAAISVEEFHTLNRCLDTAIAEAVTEHGRLGAQQLAAQELERLGRSAHELRDLLSTAQLAFQLLKQGAVAINGSTGAVLGRSLTGLQALVDRSLSEVSATAGKQRQQRTDVASWIARISDRARLHAENRRVGFSVAPVDPGLTIEGDLQLLTSAVMNLLHNAFKHTPPDGRVRLDSQVHGDRLLLAVTDQCGGIPEGTRDLFQPFGDRRGADRSGLGLGLSIARKAARVHGGDILVRNMPGTGCVFTLQLPLAAPSTLADGGPETVRTG